FVVSFVNAVSYSKENTQRISNYTVVQEKTIRLGDSVTLQCSVLSEVHWYKQSAGDTLKVIWTMRESETPEFAPEFNNSRLKVNHNKHFNNLTILKTNQEDEGIYHCGFTEWRKNTEWTGTYLLVKGNDVLYFHGVLPHASVSTPGDSVTLHCSLLSNFDNKTCSGGLSMFWFREGSNPSHPSIIYTDGNRHHECQKSAATQQSCVYQFNKSINSSEEGTYYCAVATCGKILFGKGDSLFLSELLIVSLDCFWFSRAKRSSSCDSLLFPIPSLSSVLNCLLIFLHVSQVSGFAFKVFVLFFMHLVFSV
uniref:Ig-like domain-containing protein n=1 Tax=Neolamprologus brichardi TaxID=32507 RepID=A0A3Q4HLW3_NEOBR